MKPLLRRIMALEGLQIRPRRLIYLWDDGDGAAQAEAAALHREHGSEVEVIIFSWQREQRPTPAMVDP